MRDWSKEGEKSDTTKERAKNGQGRLSKIECMCVYVLGMGLCVVDDWKPSELWYVFMQVMEIKFAYIYVGHFTI